MGGHRVYTMDSNNNLYQYDLQTGTTSNLGNFGYGNHALGADDSSVWIQTDKVMKRLDITGHNIPVVTIAQPNFVSGQLLSVGDYLYAADYYQTKIIRVTKLDMTPPGHCRRDGSPERPGGRDGDCRSWQRLVFPALAGQAIEAHPAVSQGEPRSLPPGG